MKDEQPPLSIAITADPELPVPPRLYGGIERIIDMLVRGLADRGHSVTLFAHRDSATAATLVPWPGASSLSKIDTIANMRLLDRVVRSRHFDLVHSFGRVAYLLPLLPRATLPKLMTYQREVSPRSVRWGHALSRGSLHFSAISRHMVRGVERLGRWHYVENGVPMNVYEAVDEVALDAPLAFLGRIEPIKGTHLAIEIAQRSGRAIVIAGNVPTYAEAYFEDRIRPHLNGSTVRYVGPVDDEQKNKLLGSAAALLMPILWEEPFGIVMAEALACGTPVLGLRRGSVPEIIDDGTTGFVRDTVEELADCVGKLRSIERRSCRKTAEARFSDGAIVSAYLRVYRSMIGRASVEP